MRQRLLFNVEVIRGRGNGFRGIVTDRHIGGGDDSIRNNDTTSEDQRTTTIPSVEDIQIITNLTTTFWQDIQDEKENPQEYLLQQAVERHQQRQRSHPLSVWTKNLYSKLVAP